MSNIKDYIDWRGDITFEQSGFNEVDNLVLSMISYLNFGTPKSGMTFEEIYEKIFTNRKVSNKIVEKSYSDMISDIDQLFEKAALSNRFKNVKLCDFISIYDEIKESQFCAMSFFIDEETLYVAFRGTDDTLIGFKEDFNMSFSTPVSGQIESVKYLKRILSKYSVSNIYIGGHSKGGNLAVYSAYGLDENERARITKIFNNDGPGFSKEIMEEPNYLATASKVQKILPERSAVGILMYDKEEYTIVESEGPTGLIQHNGLNWKLKGTQFIRKEELHKESVNLDKTLKMFLERLSYDEKVIFVEELYNVLRGSTNATKTGDITHQKLKTTINLIKGVNQLDSEKRDLLTNIFGVLFKSGLEIRHKKL